MNGRCFGERYEQSRQPCSGWGPSSERVGLAEGEPSVSQSFLPLALAGLGSDCTAPAPCNQRHLSWASQEDKLSPQHSWLFVSGSSSVRTLTWVFWSHDYQEDNDLPKWKQASYSPCSRGKSSGVMVVLPQPLMLGEFEEIGFEASEV